MDLYDRGDPHVEWAEEISAREEPEKDDETTSKHWATFVRLRNADGKLHKWSFIGFNSEDDVNMMGVDEGQISAHNIYSNEFMFRAGPVPITIQCNDENDYGPWYLGVWQPAENRNLCWGLMYKRGDIEPTQMCYGMDYATPQGSIKRLVLKETDWWYFDVGNRVRVHKDELEQAFKRLGIWDL
jgi:hypothetical protein